MEVIVIANKKGGVGKTTTTQNVAAHFAQMGKTVLAVDMDAQANLSRAWGVTAPETSVLDVLRRKASWKEVVVPVEEGPKGGVLLAPATRDLAVLPELFAGEFGKELLLKEALDKLGSAVDMAIIDSPPALDLLAVNTYAAARWMIVPVQCEFFSLEGLRLMRDDLNRVQARLNPALQILAIVPTFVDRRKRLCRDVLNLLASLDDYRGLVTQAAIRDNVSLAEAPSNAKSIFGYDNKSYGARDYAQLAEELLERLTREVVHAA